MGVRAVNLHMADRTLPVPFHPQVMKRGRRPSGHARGHRMAFQAQLAHVVACQHARICRPVQVVTSRTQLRTQRCMLKRERAALVGMTFEARHIMTAARDAERGTGLAAVRVVTVHAMNRPLRQLVPERPLKRRADVAVATRTQSVVGLPDIRRMYAVAVVAGYSVARVRGFKAPFLPVVFDMTAEAGVVHAVRLRAVEQR